MRPYIIFSYIFVIVCFLFLFLQTHEMIDRKDNRAKVLLESFQTQKELQNKIIFYKNETIEAQKRTIDSLSAKISILETRAEDKE